MPAVIPREAFDMWLDGAHVGAHVDAETAAALLVPAPEDTFAAHEVSTAVNRTANDNAALIEPLAPGAEEPPAAKPVRRTKAKPDDGQASLF
jgi:putative SOS response-associated peptidase YedK